MNAVEAIVTALTTLVGGSVLIWRKQLMAWLRSPRGQRVLRAALTVEDVSGATTPLPAGPPAELVTKERPEVELDPDKIDTKATIGFVISSTNELVMTQGEIFGRLEERYEKRIEDAERRNAGLENKNDKLRIELNTALIKLAQTEGELAALRRAEVERDRTITVQASRIVELEAERVELRKQIAGLETRLTHSRSTSLEGP